MRTAMPATAPAPTMAKLEIPWLECSSTATAFSLYRRIGAAGVVVTAAGAGVVVPTASFAHGAAAVQQSVFLVAAVVFLLFHASIVALAVFFAPLKTKVALSS